MSKTNLDVVKKYTARFLFEADEYGEDPLEYAVEKPLIDAIKLINWLYSLGVYKSDESLEESLEEANRALEFMSRPCIDGTQFQDDEIGIFKDYPCDDEDKALEIACIVFSTYISLNLTEEQVVGTFYGPAYNTSERFEDIARYEINTAGDFSRFYTELFDSHKFFKQELTDGVDIKIVKDWNEKVYENLMQLIEL